eukprot:CAMPEP_0113934494 /NCGR_PEP_ID=MMETSP1339-20121228/1817_1 /TAXON_ID=94617 /ORGANISM="Fibrocapsa japonica" /LENGTH=388 /DNA_ID=CAMNT_0000936327 /DNA_START=73 /DNA_END=1239 /DNA_ORIENTATION=+ /assembly_acc=CAM_ASM_000762
MAMKCTLAISLLLGAFAPGTNAFVQPQPFSRVYQFANGIRSNVQMKESANDNIFSSDGFKATALSALLIAGSLFVTPQETIAAQSGGRVGGRSFSSSPTRQYASPPVQQQYAPSAGTVPVPVPVSPFGFSPFGYGFGFGMSPFGFGVSYFNPINAIVLGAVAYGVISIIGGLTSSGQWGTLDDEEGPSSLGQGVSVLKFQLALNVKDRTAMSLLNDLRVVSESSSTSSRFGLSNVVSEVALTLLRRSAEWEAVASELQYFGPRDASKAESAFGRISTGERSKVQQESGQVDGMSVGGFANQKVGAGDGDATLAVVTIALALRGDSLKSFDGVNNISQAQAALRAISADVATDGGENVLAAEVLWTPENPSEVLSKQDVIMDFPELMDL